MAMISVRTFQPDEPLVYRDLRLAALEESPHAFGSTLAAEQPDTLAQWTSRLQRGCASARDLPVLGQVGPAPAGLAWGQVDPSDSTVVNLYQMWVAPEFRGLGLARLLLRRVVHWAASLHARSVQLGVTCGPSPARQLYASEGFIAVGAPQPLRPGAALLAQTLQRRIDHAGA